MNQFFIKLLIYLGVIVIIHTNTFLIAGASSASRPIVTRTSKCVLAPELLAEAQQAKMSILKPKDAEINILYQNYPDGSVLFPNNQDVALKFNIMIGSIKKNPDLIEFFRKIHTNSLNQLYVYLMKIYTNLNLTNPGSSQETETTTADVSAYLLDEAIYATNKKKLIMNHFINLIQAQFAASIISYAPATVPDTAVTIGKIFVQNDCGIDLTPFAQPQRDPAIIAQQAIYINFLHQYIDFFRTYTKHLSQIDTNGISQFYTMASAISKSTSNNQFKMNPSMFFYDIESMRAIQFIPFVASTIPTSSKLIPWAPIIVNAVAKKLTTNGHQVAYFKDAAGKVTPNQNQAQSLYFLTETGPVLFEQELLAQPAWLNVQDGAIRILRGCLGDFSALVGIGILDSETETIIQKAMSGMTPATINT